MKTKLLLGMFSGGLVLAMNAAPVQWNEVPPVVKQVVNTHTGGATISDYHKQSVHGSTVYHFAFTKNGQPEQLELSDTGTVLRTIYDTHTTRFTPGQWNFVPAPVRTAAVSQFGGSNFDRMEKSTVSGQPIYYFTFNKNGTPTTIALTEQGAMMPDLASAMSSSLGSSSVTPATTAVPITPPTPGTAAGGTTMEFKDLPWTVQKPILETSGYAPIKTVEKRVHNDRTIYVANYEKDGTQHQIRVDEKGTVLNNTGSILKESAGAHAAVVPLSNASKVQLSDVPTKVQNVFKTQAAGATIEDIDKGMLDGKVVYEAAFKKNGKTTEFRVREDGTPLGEHLD